MINSNNYSNIIAWSKNGTMLNIIDPLKLTQNVLHLYFKHNKFASFIRQLNNYDFHKVDSDIDGNNIRFKHKYFKKDMKYLLK